MGRTQHHLKNKYSHQRMCTLTMRKWTDQSRPWGLRQGNWLRLFEHINAMMGQPPKRESRLRIERHRRDKIAEGWSAKSKNGGEKRRGQGEQWGSEENICKCYLGQSWRKWNVVLLLCNPFILVLRSLRRIVISLEIHAESFEWEMS